MSRRLSDPVHAPLRGEAIDITFGGERVRAFEGETIAAALCAGDVGVLSRSLKYHRPRSLFCLSGHCGGCLVRVDGVPNLRACQIPCRAGQEIAAQNAFPSAEVDLLESVDWFFPGGMNHHTLMTGSRVLNAVANKVVRQLSGLGQLPVRPPDTIPPVLGESPDVIVVGGGPAGLAAATAAAHAGARTLLVDEQPALGGSLLADPRHGPADAGARVACARAAGARLEAGAIAVAFYPDEPSGIGAGDGPAAGVLAVATANGLRRVHPRCVVYATGGYPANLLFGNNDRPGIFAARAVGRLLVQHGIVVGERVAIVAGGDHPEIAAYAAALARRLADAGAEPISIEHAPDRGVAVVQARGRRRVEALDVRGPDGKRRRLDCDAVAVVAPPAPASEAARQHGCAVELDPGRGGFRVVADPDGRTSAPAVLACGDVCGHVGPDEAARQGARAGATAARIAGRAPTRNLP